MTRKMANYNQVKVLTDSICEKLNITDEDEIQDAYVVAMECIKKIPGLRRFIYKENNIFSY